jgi:very-short-patch-repair endonuclease
VPRRGFRLDAYWEDRQLGAEADGAAFHLSAEEWDGDLRRQDAVQSTGIRLLCFPVRRLRKEPASCAAELRRAYEGRVE